MAMVSAIQEAQKDNLRSFNDYMMKVLQVMIYFFPIQIFGFVSLYLDMTLSHTCLLTNTNTNTYICRHFLELRFSFKILNIECPFWTIHNKSNIFYEKFFFAL